MSMYLSKLTSTLLGSLLIMLLCWQCSSSAAAESAEEPNDPTVPAVSAAPRINSYNTLTASPSTEATNLLISGRTQAVEATQIVAEVNGKIKTTKKLLNEGVTYRRGETMVRIDDEQYQLNLRAQRSQFHAALVRILPQIQLDYAAHHPAWDSYLRTFDEQTLLPDLPEVTDDQLRFFLSANNVYASYYSIKSAEEMLPKYQITAPFSGVVTQGSLGGGTVVAPGAPLAQYSRTDLYELKAAVSSSQIDLLKTGQKLNLQHRNTNDTWVGTVHRIGKTIDPGTQAIPVFIRVSGKGLRAGMFLEASLQSDSFADVVALPSAALNRNNQVHLIVDSTVRLQDVEPVHYADNEAWVTGLQAGQVVITDATIEPIVGTKAIAK